MAKTILERLLGYESYDEGRDPLDTGYGNIEPKPMGAAEFGKGLLDMGGQAARGTVAGAIALPHDISTIGTALYQLQDDLPDRDKMNWWEAFGTRMANAEAAQPDWLPSYQDADQALPEFTPMSETFADYSEGNRPIETFSSMAFAPYPYVKAYQGLKGIPNPLREGGALNPKRVEGVVESPRIRLLEQMDEQAQLPPPQKRLEGPVPEEEIQNFIVTGKQPYSWNLSDTQVDIPLEKMGNYAFNQMADPRAHWKYKDATLYDPRSESELVPLITKSGDQILSNRQADVNDLQWNWAHRAPPSIMNMSKEQFKPPIPENPNEVPAYGEHLDFKGRDPESGKWLVEPKRIQSQLYDYALDGDFFKMARRDEMLIKPKTLRQTENLWYNGFRPKRGTDAFNEYKTWPELNAALRDKKIDHNDLPYFEFHDRFARTKEDFPLVAQHNISDFQSLEALVKEGKGQLVAPSLSVSPAENPNDQFGKISLLFDPKIIDEPTTASYSHDAYTGRVDLPKKRYQRTDVYDGLRDKLPLLKDVDNAQFEKYYNDYLEQNEMVPKYHGHQERNFNDFVRSMSMLEQSARADGQTLAEHIKMYEEIGVRPWFGMKNSRGYIDEPGLGGYADPQLMFTGDAHPNMGPTGAIPAYKEPSTSKGVNEFVGPFGMYSPERALQAFKARKGTQKGSEGIVNQRAMVAKKFSGLEDMQQNRHLIETDETVFPWSRNASRNQWPKIQKDIRDVVQANMGGDFDKQNEIGEIFATKLLNDESVKDFFGKDPWSKGDIENITSQIKDWQRYFSEMVPGDYFEAKVGRNVSLNEVRLAMIPDDFLKDPDLLNKTINLLQDAGVQKVLTYGSRKEREAILKRHPELLLTVVGMTLMAPILLQQEQGDGS